MAARLWFLHCGWLIEANDEGVIERIQVPCYLIESEGRHYLVDTGNPAALIGAADCQPWFGAGAEIMPADDPIARLAELGFQPTDVDAVIATHFDFDHAGRYDAFGPVGTDVYVQRAHIRDALSQPDEYDATLWKVPGLRWRQVDGDTWITPDIQVLRTDGHAVGHQSLLVLTGSGPVILAADACDGQTMFDNRVFPDYYDDVETANASIDRLVALAAELNAPIIFGHDPKQWATLPHSPDEYRGA
jgi:N-acyl homoserine lactone hydrolase